MKKQFVKISVTLMAICIITTGCSGDFRSKIDDSRIKYDAGITVSGSKIPYAAGRPDDEIDQEFSVTPVTESGLLGSYDGISLIGFGDDWTSTFGADGWTFNNADGEHTFMTAVNPKYDNAEVYVYNYSRSAVSSMDILKYGFFGYDIECGSTAEYPPMTWNGLTFAASAGDILAVYGEPDYEHAETEYTVYGYGLSDEHELTFYISPDKGLYRVVLCYYDDQK